MKEMYCGYSIFYYSADGWHAFAYRPGETTAYGRTVRASAAEGAEVLLKRVQAGIDAELIKTALGSLGLWQRRLHSDCR